MPVVKVKASDEEVQIKKLLLKGAKVIKKDRNKS